MIPNVVLSAWPLSSSAWIAVLIEAALKGTALLAVASLAHLALRRASAAARHLLWTAALAGMLALPPLSLLLPSWSVPSLRWPSAASLASGPAAPAAPRAIESPVAAASAKDAGARAVRSSEPDASPAGPATNARAAAPAPAAAPAIATPAARFDWTKAIAMLWMIGAAITLVPIAAGHLALRRLARRARSVREPEWTTLLERCASDLGIRRRVALVRGDRAAMPMTWGLTRPAILLPADADAWPADRRRVVMLHELAHIERRDCLTQALAQLACVVFWFHPAVWAAASRLRVERERACDDRVLDADTRASDYADHLLQVVRAAREPGLGAFGAVAFARASQFEGRLLAVLDPRRDRRALTTPRVLRVATAALVVLLPLAALAPWRDTAGAAIVLKQSGRDHRSRLIGGTDTVLRAPDEAAALEQRLDWAGREARRVAGSHGYWIGYAIRRDARRAGSLDDSEGIDLDVLSDSWHGPTLFGVLEEGKGGKAATGASAKDGVAILIHYPTGGAPWNAFDRVRVQTLELPAEIGGAPLLWLETVPDEASLHWLEKLERETPHVPLRTALLAAIAEHESAELATPYLLELLKSREPDEVRGEAAEQLGRNADDKTLDALTWVIHNDPSPEVRERAVQALGHSERPRAAASLLAMARSKTEPERVRRASVEALTERASAEAVQGLDEVLGDPPAPRGPMTLNSGVSVHLGRGNGRVVVSPDGDTTIIESGGGKRVRVVTDADGESIEVPDVMVLEDSEGDDAELAVRRQAVESLGHMPEALALPRLVQIANSNPSSRLRRQAVESIGNLGGDRAFAELQRIAWRSSDEELQSEVVESLSQFPEATCLPKLIEVARRHPSTRVRRTAIEQLGQRDPSRTLETLEQIAGHDPDESIQRAAVEAMGQMPDEICVPRLERIARNHPRPAVRRAAVEQLGNRDPDKALPVLERLINEASAKRTQ